MKTIVMAVGLSAAVMTAGCSTAYKDAGRNDGRGYSSQRISDDVFTVSFVANSATKPEKARDFVLLRASEIAVKNGFDYMRVVDADDASAVKTLPVMGTSYLGAYSPQNASAGFSSGHEYELTVTKPAYEIRVVCRRERPTGDEQNWWPAKETVARLRAKYGLG